jgi:dTDP-4-dehydrorhamnose reductase
MKQGHEILIIGNKGKLLKLVYEKLNQLNDSNVNLMYSQEIENNIHYKTISQIIVNTLNAEIKFNYIIYIGGEVRDEKKMDIKNVQVPLELHKFSIVQDAIFIYLSTLSVYENLANTETIINEEIAPLNCETKYAKTKLLLDKEIAKSENFICIKPASIIGSERLNSSLDNLLKVLLKYPLINKLEIPGKISFISMEEISDFISYSIINLTKGETKILSHNLPISTIQKFVLTKLGLSTNQLRIKFFWDFIKFASIFLTEKHNKIITNLLNKKTYISEKKFPLKDPSEILSEQFFKLY